MFGEDACVHLRASALEPTFTMKPSFITESAFSGDVEVSMRSSPPQSSHIADQAFGQKSRMGMAL